MKFVAKIDLKAFVLSTLTKSAKRVDFSGRCILLMVIFSPFNDRQVITSRRAHRTSRIESIQSMNFRRDTFDHACQTRLSTLEHAGFNRRMSIFEELLFSRTAFMINYAHIR